MYPEIGTRPRSRTFKHQRKQGSEYLLKEILSKKKNLKEACFENDLPNLDHSKPSYLKPDDDGCFCHPTNDLVNAEVTLLL